MLAALLRAGLLPALVTLGGCAALDTAFVIDDPGDCGTRTYPGSYKVQRPSDWEALAASYDWVDGNLLLTGSRLLGEQVLDDLCGVLGRVAVNDVEQLADLALADLRYVQGGLVIRANPRLEALEMDSLESVGLGTSGVAIEFTDNPSLSCEVIDDLVGPLLDLGVVQLDAVVLSGNLCPDGHLIE